MTTSADSPCRQICQLTPDRQFCMGCGRTLKEIAQWSRMSEEARRTANRDAARRLATPGLREDADPAI